MKWLGWAFFGLIASVVSVFVVHLLASVVFAASGPPPHKGYDVLALAAVDIIGGLGSFVVSVLVLPTILAVNEGIFWTKASILIPAAVIAMILLPFLIVKNFDLGIILFAAPALLSATAMALIAYVGDN